MSKASSQCRLRLLLATVVVPCFLTADSVAEGSNATTTTAPVQPSAGTTENQLSPTAPPGKTSSETFKSLVIYIFPFGLLAIIFLMMLCLWWGKTARKNAQLALNAGLIDEVHIGESQSEGPHVEEDDMLSSDSILRSEIRFLATHHTNTTSHNRLVEL
jgi:hypothetical protein